MPPPKPTQHAREQIDAHLVAWSWVVQDCIALNLGAGRGIALREVPMKSGRCDYLLLADRIPVGVVEARKEGTTLSTAHPFPAQNLRACQIEGITNLEASFAAAQPRPLPSSLRLRPHRGFARRLVRAPAPATAAHSKLKARRINFSVSSCLNCWLNSTNNQLPDCYTNQRGVT